MPLHGRIRPAYGKPQADDLLNAHEVAKLCRMSHSRVCQLLRAGTMRGTKLWGNWWHVERAEAERFVQQPPGAGRPRGS